MAAAKAQTLVDTKIAGKKVVVFSKSWCPYCAKVKKLLAKYKLSEEDLEVIELDKGPHMNDAEAIQNYLNKITGARSVSINQYKTYKIILQLQQDLFLVKDKDSLSWV